MTLNNILMQAANTASQQSGTYDAKTIVSLIFGIISSIIMVAISIPQLVST
ncbi:UNVERIFIED_CONTAM: hypothetical protein O8I53_11170 [Campylobacter lari]